MKLTQQLYDRINLTTYYLRGRIPWSRGYIQHKDRFLRSIINNPNIIEKFGGKENLPVGFGMGLDERVIEFPWCAFHASQLKTNSRILDAGSTFNFDYIIDQPWIKNNQLTIMTLAPEPNCFWHQGISYVFGDVRKTSIKDAWFDAIFCVSVLEHIGMDNTAHYTSDASFRESKADSYLEALYEFRRLLKPGGKLFVTVPFGKYRNYVHFQQFDASMIRDVVRVFKPSHVSEVYYQYAREGWGLTSQAACAELEYNQGDEFTTNVAAAANSVACIKLQK